jgi:glycosyltransferase involved in cell wall biosynthesis
VTNTPPLVSVVVPVHNGERFLAETIESLLGQDHPAIEIVAVDDGSTDASAAILGRFAEVVVITQENQGVAAARNAGLTRARGEFLAFCDQDDLHLPHKTRIQLDHLAAHPEVSYVTGRQVCFFEPGTPKPDWLLPDPVYGDLGGVLPLSGLARREVVEIIGGFDPAVGCSDDFDWVMRMRAAGLGVATIDEVVLRRRIHDGNASHEPGVLRRGTVRSVHKLLRAKRATQEARQP